MPASVAFRETCFGMPPAAKPGRTAPRSWDVAPADGETRPWAKHAKAVKISDWEDIKDLAAHADKVSMGY